MQIPTTMTANNNSSSNKNDEETTLLLNNSNNNSNNFDDVYDVYDAVNNNHGLQQQQSSNEEAVDDDDDNTRNTTHTARRYFNLFLIVCTTPGIKYFKSAQSSFQEYLMQDPKLQLSATTYGLILTLISMPVVPLIGGILLDYKGGRGGRSSASVASDRVDGEIYIRSSSSKSLSSKSVSSSTNGEDDEIYVRPDGKKVRRIRRRNDRNNSNNTADENAGTVDFYDDEIYCDVTATNDEQQGGQRRNDFVTSLRTLAYGTKVRTGTVEGAHSSGQSKALCLFSVVTLCGIIVYGIGLEYVHSIPVGLMGAAIFGLGEGCIMVAARAFIGLEFMLEDGATAQGFLIAMNNLSMMASKNSIPWLIENSHQHRNNENDDYSITIGIVACISVQLVSTIASIWYSIRCGSFQKQQQQQQQEQQKQQQKQNQQRSSQDRNLQQVGEKKKQETKEQQEQYHNNNNYQQNSTGLDGGGGDAVNRNTASSNGMSSCCGGIAATGCAQSGVTSITTLFHLPITFWIVAIARAIFLVTFKVFSRYSNSFLIEQYGASAVMAGRKSSLNELFALFSPLVGFLAYRSPGGIVPFVIGGGILGAISIGLLTFIPPELITLYLPGGNVTPLIGISIAHGIIVPIMIAIIPHTVTPVQLGMAFAVVEVLGNTLNLTDIVFGWLRDISGDYVAPMKLLFVYALIGISLLLASRDRIGKIGIGRSNSNSNP